MSFVAIVYVIVAGVVPLFLIMIPTHICQPVVISAEIVTVLLSGVLL